MIVINTIDLLPGVDTGAETFAYVREVDAFFAYEAGSSATADGWVVIAPDVGSGRWLLQSDGLMVPPLGSAANDTPRLTAARNALAAHGKTLRLAPAAYTCADIWNLGLLGTRIIGTSQTVIESTITPDGSPSTALFYATPGAIAASTTIAAANSLSALTVSSAASMAVGKFVRIVDNHSAEGKHGSTYEVMAVSGSGPYTLTLDRPVRTQFGTGDAIDVFDAIPSEHHIVGNGMRVIGTGTRLHELICTRRCVTQDLIFEPDNIESFLASFDLFGYDNHFRRVTVSGRGGCAAGLVLESQENSSIESEVRDVAGPGILLQDCVSCEDRSIVTGCQFGAAVVADGNTKGCLDCGLFGTYNSNSVQGISVTEGSRNTRINATAKFNPTNLAIGDGSGGNVTGTTVSGDFRSASTIGISLFASALGTVFGVIDTSDSAVAVSNQTVISIGLHRHRGTLGATGNVLLNDGGAVHVALCDYNVTTGNVNVVKTVGDGVTTYDAGEIVAGAASNLFYGDGTSRTVIGAVTGAAGGTGVGVNLNATGATVQLSPGTDFTGCNKATNGTGTILVPRRTLSKQIGAVGTTAVTTEETLKSYTLPANTIKPGQKLVIRGWGTSATNANAKTVRLRIGGTSVSAQNLATGTAVNWTVEAELHSTGANAQEYRALFVGNGTTAPTSGSLTRVDTSPIAIILTGQNGTASANDIVARGFEVIHTSA